MAFFDLLEREAEPWKDPVEVPTATGAHHRVGCQNKLSKQ